MTAVSAGGAFSAGYNWNVDRTAQSEQNPVYRDVSASYGANYAAVIGALAEEKKAQNR